MRSAPVATTSANAVDVAITLERLALLKFVLIIVAEVRVALDASAEVKLVSSKSADVKLVDLAVAPVRSAFVRSALLSFADVKLVP